MADGIAMAAGVPVSLGEWLASRTPPAPDALVRRLHQMLEEGGATHSAQDVAGRCLRAAERELARLLRGDERSRECAVDLLAVDALVTYAFEAACAEDPARLAERADEAMAALSRLHATTRGD